MSFDSAKWVWMNGRCVRWDEATVHVSAHGLHYGSGVFEGVRCYERDARYSARLRHVAAEPAWSIL